MPLGHTVRTVASMSRRLVITVRLECSWGASLFPDWFYDVNGFNNDVSLVANAVPGMEFLDDFAEARIGEGARCSNYLNAARAPAGSATPVHLLDRPARHRRRTRT
jgi:hypothetical protein